MSEASEIRPGDRFEHTTGDVGRLRLGQSKSCGCYAVERSTTHGEARGGRVSTEYRSWSGMVQRCTNPRNAAWKDYGGRGISVCERWRDSFEAFLADMGRKPTSRHSIDRIDNSGGYEPGNCRWATKKEQANNRRRPRPREFLDREIRMHEKARAAS